MQKFNIMIGVVVEKGKEFALPAFKEATKKILGEGFVLNKPELTGAEQRKIIVQEAKKRNVEGVLFCECDVIPPENVLDLLKVKADIVAAAYLGWQDMGKPKVAPCAYAEAEEGIAFIPVDILVSRIALPVAAVNFGCTYVVMKALEKIEYPDGINDDIEFCKRAREKGLTVVVDGRVKATRKTIEGDLSWPAATASYKYTEDVQI